MEKSIIKLLSFKNREGYSVRIGTVAIVVNTDNDRVYIRSLAGPTPWFDMIFLALLSDKNIRKRAKELIGETAGEYTIECRKTMADAIKYYYRPIIRCGDAKFSSPKRYFSLHVSGYGKLNEFPKEGIPLDEFIRYGMNYFKTEDKYSLERAQITPEEVFKSRKMSKKLLRRWFDAKFLKTEEFLITYEDILKSVKDAEYL